MELIVRGGSEERELEIVETEAGYSIQIGEKSYAVEVVPVGATGRSLLIDGRQYDLGVRALGAGRFAVDTSESTLDLNVLDPLSRLAEDSRGGSGSAGSGRVAAYMPGRVVTLLVAEGDEVVAGQGVVVLEAMKMENEIQADRDGKIAKLYVEAGQPVDGGDPLFEIE